MRAEKKPSSSTNLSQTAQNGKKSIVGTTGRNFAEQHFQGTHVVILGLARQGMALARFFVHAGADVVISDAAPAEELEQECAALDDLPVTFVLGGHPLMLLDGCDLLCLSGGVPPQIPIVQTALERGIPLSNDSLLTLQMARGLGLGPLLAVTGSSGKTTTTTLTGEMIREMIEQRIGERPGAKAVHVGGNIGTPLLDRLDQIEPGDPILLELSSFQLELFDSTIAWGPVAGSGPDVAAILNVTPNHLDRHPSMKAYAAAKLNLLRAMPAGGTIVLNLEDPVTAYLAQSDLREELVVNGALSGNNKSTNGIHNGTSTKINGAEVEGIAVKDRSCQISEWELDEILAEARTGMIQRDLQVVPFSRTQTLTNGAWKETDQQGQNQLIYNAQEICTTAEVKLRGQHNISNLLAAAALSGSVGAGVDAMRKVATSFAGVAHRLEVVVEHGGVTWINDSIATSPERAVAGLRSFEAGKQTLILLAGGKDKNLSWEALAAETVRRVSMLIGFGQSGPMIVNLVQGLARFGQQNAPNCAVVQRLDEAVELAARVAGENSVVLLSPGGTSYDAYKNFEERGEHFRTLVDKSLVTRSLVPREMVLSEA